MALNDWPNETKSFDFIELYTGQAKTKVVRLETCWWSASTPFGTIKTKGTCPRESWLVTDVPMVRNKHVEFSLPSKIEIGRTTQEFSYDLPTVTQRDNRKDFEHSKADVERIKRELDVGKVAIAAQQVALLDEDTKKALDRIEKDTLTTFNQNTASQTAMFAQKRAELVATRDQARAAYSSAKTPMARTLPSSKHSRSSTRRRQGSSTPAQQAPPDFYGTITAYPKSK
jgi:hypothetical protein